MLNNFNICALILLFPVWKLWATEIPTIIENHIVHSREIYINCLGLLGYWTVSIVWDSEEHNVSEMGLFSSSGEKMGGIYSVGTSKELSSVTEQPKSGP
jgi:hypothetical protein